MRTGYIILLGSLLISPVSASAAQRPFEVVDHDQAGPLTLTAAKEVVSQSLLASGQRMVRVGHAEFDGNGNVLVQIETIQGIPLHQVLVDHQTHQLAAVKSRPGYKG